MKKRLWIIMQRICMFSQKVIRDNTLYRDMEYYWCEIRRDIRERDESRGIIREPGSESSGRLNEIEANDIG